MSLCANDQLETLLIIIQMRKTKPVEYSVQKPGTLWDSGDRVEERHRFFYVTLRHFSGEIIGRHVGLICDIEKLEDEWGERRTYRLPVATRQDEHLVVYVYNPTVCQNGTLSFFINTTDTQGAVQTQTVSVEADNCQAVFKFAYPSMQKGHVTRLISKDDNYLIELRIFLEGAE
jgi:hypothetical protein